MANKMYLTEAEAKAAGLPSAAEQIERHNRRVREERAAAAPIGFREQVMKYQDGTWIETNADMTEILRTWDMCAPRPKDAVYLWRRKQLLDQLAYRASLEASC
jgi:hypothetical protein